MIQKNLYTPCNFSGTSMLVADRLRQRV